jgi:nucleoid DNA-binding protein
MISKYIKELLENQNRVIVPDLGAFLHKGDSQKVIYFNEFLRFNDGLLLNYIAEQQKIDQIEAAKQLKAFVDEATKNLQARKQVTMEGIGSLYLDNNDKIQLKAEQLLAYQFEEPLTETSSIPEESLPLASDKDLLIIDNKSEEAKSDLAPPMETKPSEPAFTKEKTEIEPMQQPVKPKATSGPAPKQPLKPAPKKPMNSPSYTKSKSGGRVLWIVGLLVVAIIGILYYFVLRPLYFNKTVKQTNIAKTDTLNYTSNNHTTKDSTKEPKPAASKESLSPTGKKFYLVIGCFVQEENANKLIEKLKSEGYTPEKFAKIEEMYFVSIASYSDKSSADSRLGELKSKGYNDLWIKYY